MDMPRIIMPQPLLDKWLAALRSGDYAQATHRLAAKLHTGQTGYCCLGVLQVVADGAVETDVSGVAIGVPSLPWLDTHRVWFGRQNDPASYRTVGSPYLPTLGMGADEANDGYTESDEPENNRPGYSFREIADAIEATAQGT